MLIVQRWNVEVKVGKSSREIMFENIKAGQQEEVKQGDLLKEIEISKTRQDNYKKEAFVYGVNYYTIEKLKQIQNDALKYLSKNIDVDSIKIKISEESNPDIGTLEWLYNIENKILEVKNNLANDCDPFSKNDNLVKSSLINFVDWINGGDNNEN